VPTKPPVPWCWWRTVNSVNNVSTLYLLPVQLTRYTGNNLKCLRHSRIISRLYRPTQRHTLRRAIIYKVSIVNVRTVIFYKSTCHCNGFPHCTSTHYKCILYPDIKQMHLQQCCRSFYRSVLSSRP